MIGIGIDLASVPRFSRLAKLYGDRFLGRFLSAGELEHFRCIVAERAQSEYLASRWAAKEALFKAVGEARVSEDPLLFPEVEVVSTGAASPTFRPHSRAWKEALQDRRVLLSLTHEEGGMAAAMVTASQ